MLIRYLLQAITEFVPETAIDYDEVFRALARERGLIGLDFSGGKDAVRQAIRALPFTTARVERQHYVVRDRALAAHSCVLLSGAAVRSKIVASGQRQILAIHIKGDMIEDYSFAIFRPDDVKGTMPAAHIFIIYSCCGIIEDRSIDFTVGINGAGIALLSAELELPEDLTIQSVNRNQIADFSGHIYSVTGQNWRTGGGADFISPQLDLFPRDNDWIGGIGRADVEQPERSDAWVAGDGHTDDSGRRRLADLPAVGQAIAWLRQR